MIKQLTLQQFLFFLSLLFAFSCSENKQIKETIDGYEHIYEVDKKEGRKNGKYQLFNENEVLISEGVYSKGLENGQFKRYYPSGKVEEVMHFVNGAYHGTYELFHENGNLKQRYQYVNDFIEGEMLVYYESGKLKEAIQFVKGVEDGIFKEYYENGQLSTEGTYIVKNDSDPLEVGELKQYDEMGQLIRKAQCEINELGGNFFSICQTLEPLEK